MNWFEKIIVFLQTTMETPKLYGWFHLLAFALVIAVTLIIAIKCKNCSEKVFRKVLLIISLVMIGFEIYKQVIWSYNAATDVWHYNWYYFPWQFCSVPMYVALLVAVCKEST